jgi:hypothetical protein
MTDICEDRNQIFYQMRIVPATLVIGGILAAGEPLQRILFFLYNVESVSEEPI